MPANNSTEPAGDIIASYFMERGSQYYTVGRLAMHAQCFPVCGNLFHHTVEMLLKGGLAQKRALSDLKRMRHKLDELWQAFKVDFPDSTLQRHDETISGLNKFEETRYANPDKVPSMMGVAHWLRLPVDPIETSGELRTLKQYNLFVEEIDDLVADVFKSCSIDPASPALLGRTNPAALEAIIRNNAHSEFLTRRS